MVFDDLGFVEVFRLCGGGFVGGVGVFIGGAFRFGEFLWGGDLWGVFVWGVVYGGGEPVCFVLFCGVF